MPPISRTNWLPQLPAAGDHRPWPPGWNELASRDDVVTGANKVIQQCMLGRKGAGYARTGNLEEGLGVFIWAGGSDVDVYTESLLALRATQGKAGRPVFTPLFTNSTATSRW